MKFFLFILLSFISCSDTDNNVICTEEFAMVNVYVMDEKGNQLNELSSKSFNENYSQFDLGEDFIGSGNYLVMSDKFNKDLGTNEKIEFQLFKNDSLIHEEIYYISGGECHISKISGKDTIVIQNQ